MSVSLLFIHGSGFTATVFEAQHHAFAGSRAVNLPGHLSPGTPSSVGEFADYLEQYITAASLESTVVCGHSLGGAIALELALRRVPQVAALVLLGAGARLRVAANLLEGLQHDFAQTARKIAGQLYADPSSPLVAQAVASFESVGESQTLRDFKACNAFDVTADLSSVRVPVLAITGDRDVMTPPKYAHALAEAVLDGTVRIIGNAGHMVMQEQPAETNIALKNFVTGLDRRLTESH